MNKFNARPKLRNLMQLNVDIDGKGAFKVREDDTGRMLVSLDSTCPLDHPKVQALMSQLVTERSKRIEHLETELARARMLLADSKTQETRMKLDKNEITLRYDKLRRDVNAALYSGPSR